jgi:hypothetical protein
MDDIANVSKPSEGDVVACSCCGQRKAIYRKPYPPDEQLCTDCESVIQAMREAGEL